MKEEITFICIIIVSFNFSKLKYGQLLYFYIFIQCRTHPPPMKTPTHEPQI